MLVEIIITRMQSIAKYEKEIMAEIIINKTFNDYKECEKWENENLSQIANGKTVLMVNHESTTYDTQVKLVSIYVI